MAEIQVYKPNEEELVELGVRSWPIWTCEPSTFDWHYDDKETCYLLEGQVSVKTDHGEVSFGAGDMVVFPQGLSCVWQVSEGVRKHYKFG
jgi:uncharacterized cupin superfamily protein